MRIKDRSSIKESIMRMTAYVVDDVYVSYIMNYTYRIYKRNEVFEV